MSKQLEQRITRLEERKTEQPIGMWWDGDVFVSGGEGLTPDKWPARHRGGMLIRVVYVDDWRSSQPMPALTV